MKVQFPYQAADPHQLSLVEGEILTVIQRNPGGWWIGRNEDGEIGLFPSSYTTEVKEKPKFNVPKELKTSQLLGGQGGSGLDNSSSSAPSLATSMRNQEESRRNDQKMRELLGLEADEEEEFFSSKVSPTMLRVSTIRAECRALSSDIEKLNRKRGALDAQKKVARQEGEKLGDEIKKITLEIHTKNVIIQKLERTVEVLKAALIGCELPKYAPDQLWPVDGTKGLKPSEVQLPPASSPAVTPTSSSLMGFPTSAHTFSLESSANNTADEASMGTDTDLPFDEALCQDPVALKLIKKLKKRIAEAEGTKEEYAKQDRKLRKKLQKLEQASSEQAEAEKAVSAANSVKVTQLKEQIAAAEAKLSKYQDPAIEKELAEQSTELKNVIAKLNKRLTKGTAANEEIKTQLATVKNDATNAASTLAKLKGQRAEAQSSKTAAAADLEKAKQEEIAALESVAQETADLDQRLAKETARVAEFKEQLRALKLAAGQAA